MTLALVAMLPFLAAGVLACLPDRYRRTSAWIAGVASLLAFVLVLQFGAQVLAGEIPGVRYSFLPELGLNIGFRLDGLAFAFALLILGIGTLVVLYGAYYLSAEDPPARFFSFLMLFMGAMLGIVLAREGPYEVVGEAGTGFEALKVCRRVKPHLVCLLYTSDAADE